MATTILTSEVPMGRYRIALVAFGVVALLAAAVIVMSNDLRVVGVALIVTVLMGAGVNAFIAVSAQQRLEAVLKRSAQQPAPDLETFKAQQTRLVEVATKQMPASHAEQLVRTLDARADRLEVLIRSLGTEPPASGSSSTAK